MTYNFFISKRAEEDIRVAFEWYEKQENGLGKKFLEAIDKSFSSIKYYPLFYGFRKGNIRGCKTKHFPFLILYYVEAKNIKIVSVFHTSKKPNP